MFGRARRDTWRTNPPRKRRCSLQVSGQARNGIAIDSHVIDLFLSTPLPATANALTVCSVCTSAKNARALHSALHVTFPMLSLAADVDSPCDPPRYAKDEGVARGVRQYARVCAHFCSGFHSYSWPYRCVEAQEYIVLDMGIPAKSCIRR